MNVLPFRRPENSTRLQRAQAILELAGVKADIDHGVSDEGEPWMAVSRIDTGDVILHMAVIGGQLVTDSHGAGCPLQGHDLGALLDTIRSA